tara:strand:- start:48 stop:635 length:588 start_codon:yes stop_codon:yes gene_type:complete
MKKNKIILIGAGGHAVSCIDVIEKTKKFKIEGLIDNSKKNHLLVGEKKYKIFNENLFKKSGAVKYAIICLGSEKFTKKRRELFIKYKSLGYSFPKIISPLSYVSNSSTVGEGSIIMHGVIINANVKIGKNCIINTKSIIEHDCNIGSNSHVATSVVMNGHVSVKENCFIGSNSTIIPSAIIKKNSFIKANSLVKK